MDGVTEVIPSATPRTDRLDMARRDTGHQGMVRPGTVLLATAASHGCPTFLTE